MARRLTSTVRSGFRPVVVASRSHAGLSLSVPERVRYRAPAGWVRQRLERPGSGAAGGLHQPCAGSVSVSSDRIQQRRCLERNRGDDALRSPRDVLANVVVPAVGRCVVRTGRMGLYRLRVRQVARQLSTRFEERLRSEHTSRRNCTIRCCRASSAHPCSYTSPSIGCRRILQRCIASSGQPDLMGKVIDEGRNAVRGLRSRESASQNSSGVSPARNRRWRQ